MGTTCIVIVFLFVEYFQYIQNIQVATFCEYSKVEEEQNDGEMSLDSVELCVPYQEDSCVCHVTVKFNLLPPAIIQIRKHDDQTKNATTIDNCGSIIDIERQYKNGSKDILSPFECQSENDLEFSVGDLDIIQLTSRPTNRSLLGGYCLTVHREHNGLKAATLTLECFQPKNYTTTDSMTTTEVSKSTDNNAYLEDSTVIQTSTDKSSSIQVSYDKTESLPTSQTEQTSSVHNGTNTTTLTLECFQPKSYTTTDSMITTEDSTVIQTSTDESSSTQVSYDKTESQPISQTEQTSPDSRSQNDKTKLYTVVGSCAGGGLVVVLIVLGVACFRCRQKPDENTHIRNSPIRNSKNEDYDSYGLKDNVLYVSSDVQRVDDGNYSYVDVESSQSTTEDNAGKIGTYGTVDNDEENTKIKRSDSTSQKPIDSPSDYIGGDQTNAVEYAVVDKTIRSQLSQVSSID